MSAATRWPSAVDYQTALQVPAACFNNPDLRRGSVATDPLGLPLVATGNVAVVFRMRMAWQDVALRCFTRKSSFTALERRYQALSLVMDQFHIPALVACTYRPDEMLVAGTRYAVVQMEWVNGVHLHRYLEQQLAYPEVLDALSDQWRSLMAQVRAARLAHGDLADGNILVDVQGRLRLIDYDGVYVAALNGDPPGELGKPNYQHPARFNSQGPEYGYYAANADAFSALVIYLSMRAVADDPGRWQRYHNGENLIFRQDDFLQPGATPIWTDLRRSKDPEVVGLMEALQYFCTTSLSELPFLEDVLIDVSPRPAKRPATTTEVLTNYLLGREGTEAREWERSEEVGPANDYSTRISPRSSPVQLPETERDGARGWWRGPRIAGVGVGMALLIFVGLLWISNGSVLQASLLPPPTQALQLDPEELQGSYTGYALTQSGEREPLRLTISAPSLQTSDDVVHFSYSINWKDFQANGVGSYKKETGRLDLENYYGLYVASATDLEIILVSVFYQGPDPIVKINKRRPPP